MHQLHCVSSSTSPSSSSSSHIPFHQPIVAYVRYGSITTQFFPLSLYFCLYFCLYFSLYFSLSLDSLNRPFAINNSFLGNWKLPNRPSWIIPCSISIAAMEMMLTSFVHLIQGWITISSLPPIHSISPSLSLSLSVD